MSKMKHYGPKVAISYSVPDMRGIDAALVTDCSPPQQMDLSTNLYYPHQYLKPAEVRWYQKLALKIGREWGINNSKLLVENVNLSSLIDTVDCYQHLRFYLEDFVLFRRFIDSLAPSEILIDRNLSWLQRETINIIAESKGIKTNHQKLVTDNQNLRAPFSIAKKMLNLRPRFGKKEKFQKGEYFVLQYERDIKTFGSMLTDSDSDKSWLIGEKSILEAAEDLPHGKIAVEQFLDSSLLHKFAKVMAEHEIWNITPEKYLADLNLDPLLARAINYTFPFNGKKALPHLLVMLLMWQKICRQIPDGSVVWVSADFHPQGRAVCELLRKRNIETRTIVHGMYSEQYFPVHADRVYIDGDVTRDWFLTKGLKKSRFKMFGSALVDKYRDFKTEPNLTGKYRIWLAIGPMSRYSNYWMIKEFLKLFYLRKNVSLAIKLHPAQSKKEMLNMIELLGADADKIRIEKKMDFKEVLENCDLLTLHSSTVGMEAMHCGVSMGMIRAGILKPVHVMASLLDTDVLPNDPQFDIEEWISDPERQKRQKKFGDSYLGATYRK